MVILIDCFCEFIQLFRFIFGILFHGVRIQACMRLVIMCSLYSKIGAVPSIQGVNVDFRCFVDSSAQAHLW
jgi:hypothetical protein